jgi:hypothetical protein
MARTRPVLIGYPQITPSPQIETEDAGFRRENKTMMLAVTAGAFLMVTRIAAKGLFFFLQESPIQ